MPPKRGGPAAGNGQHYESFIVRVLLNDDGSIRDTRMERIGTGEVKRWAGWEHEAMLGFVKEAAAPCPSRAARGTGRTTRRGTAPRKRARVSRRTKRDQPGPPRQPAT